MSAPQSPALPQRALPSAAVGERHQAEDVGVAASSAFARAGLTPPACGEVCAFVFDAAHWQKYVASAHGLLDASELARAARFRFEHDRTTYVLAHALWRLALGSCLGIDASRVRFAHTAAGQPQLPGTGLATSLSHSGSAIAIAIGKVAIVGIDIERAPARVSLAALIPTICTAAERERLDALPEAAREPALLRLWTRKEALLKAFGLGLAADPALLATTGAVSAPWPTLQPLPDCRVNDMELPTGWVGALAVPLATSPTRLYRLDDAAGARPAAGSVS
jgi:4'-phosphopantetheinyl transferase